MDIIKEVKRMFIVVIFFAIVFGLFFYSSYGVKVNKENSELVVFGDNIKTDYKPFVENDNIYISLDTISKTIDEHIFYDKVATKVIVTTYSDVVKFKIDENKMSKNFEYSDIDSPAKLVEGQPYVSIKLLKDIYNIKIEYNEETNTVTIDKLDTTDIPLLYNKIKVYSEISTNSNVLDTLNKSDKVTLYKDSLNHSRWYKIKTASGMVGYISKNNISDTSSNVSSNEENKNNEAVKSTEKINMFWQYGSDLNVLGKSKIEGVNVVSPTWYELSNSNGDISSKYSKEYYSQAKSFGYKIWPIITNGIDSSTYMPSDTSNMINSEYSREQFIKNLVGIAKKDKLDGINIDFEAMKTEDKDLYTQFIREMSPLLRKENVTVSVDMYFVSYVDRKGVGEACDYTILMGYDQRGNWSTEIGSISEVSWVEENLNSLINDSKISSDKIILGVPFYTRLWITKKGEVKPTTKIYTMQDCKDFVAKYKLTPVFDQDAGQNFVEYTEGNLNYKLWIEDKDSIKRRVETVKKYNLAGITGWRKGLETSDIWNVINENLK